jgi:phage repressor protein C with HTH and peptisase S24 domain
MDLNAILARIQTRLEAVGLTESAASKLAGKPDAIRNLRRKIEKGAPAGITTTTLAALAPILRTNVAWLMEGVGDAENPPAPAASIPVHGCVVAGIVDFEWKDTATPDAISLPAEGDIAALVVRGDSQYPHFKQGEFILYDPHAMLPEQLVGQYAIVKTIDGRLLLKILEESGRPGLWTLRSHNAPAQKNVELLAAWRYLGALAPFISRSRERMS